MDKKEHNGNYTTHHSLFDANFQSPALGTLDPSPRSDKDTETSREGMDSAQEKA